MPIINFNGGTEHDVFEFIGGIALGAVAGGVIKMIIHGGGAIVGRDNVLNAISKEERNVRGRFNDLKVTKDDPKTWGYE